MYGRSFISLRDATADDLERLLRLAAALKSGRRRVAPVLQDRTLGLLFNATSTRTRLSFQVATRALGGHAEHLAAGDLAMANDESVADTASVMGRFLDGLVIRLYEMNRSGDTTYGSARQALLTFAERAGVPVINALDDEEHPTQVLADLLTIRERFPSDVRRRKVVVAWAYSDKQKSIGVTHSWLVAAAALGMRLTLAYPKGFEPAPEYAAFAERARRASGGTLDVAHDLAEACSEADVVYTKSYKSLTLSTDADRVAREELRSAWCLTEAHFARARRDAVYMNCLPMVRGQEATAEVADGPRSIIYDEAENCLHARTALLAAIYDPAALAAA